jgi:hypothetical protein
MSAPNSQPVGLRIKEEFKRRRRENYNGLIVPHLKHAGMVFERAQERCWTHEYFKDKFFD